MKFFLKILILFFCRVEVEYGGNQDGLDHSFVFVLVIVCLICVAIFLYILKKLINQYQQSQEVNVMTSTTLYS